MRGTRAAKQWSSAMVVDEVASSTARCLAEAPTHTHTRDSERARVPRIASRNYSRELYKPVAVVHV